MTSPQLLPPRTAPAVQHPVRLAGPIPPTFEGNQLGWSQLRPVSQMRIIDSFFSPVTFHAGIGDLLPVGTTVDQAQAAARQLSKANVVWDDAGNRQLGGGQATGILRVQGGTEDGRLAVALLSAFLPMNNPITPLGGNGPRQRADVVLPLAGAELRAHTAFGPSRAEFTSPPVPFDVVLREVRDTTVAPTIVTGRLEAILDAAGVITSRTTEPTAWPEPRPLDTGA